MTSRRTILLSIPLGLVCLRSHAQPAELTVSVAASLTDVMRTLGSLFEAANPPSRVRFNFGASGALMQQITQGAPVDVFVSADEETLERGLAQKLLVANSRRDVAGNSVVLITPAGEPGISSLRDLAGPAVRRIAIGKPLTVPAGRYAQQALETAGLWSTLQPRFVFADNVRQVLDYVARGEVAAGFVYATDATLFADRVRVVQVVSGHAPVRYPAAVVAGSRHPDLARAFVDFLVSNPAQQRFIAAGFLPAGQ
jgi:molybdate transport system substrate-binding protein